MTASSIAANFNLPPGEITVAAVVDLNASASNGDGNRRALLASTTTVANPYAFTQQNRQPTLFTSGLYNSAQGPALSVAAPHLLIFAWSAADQEVAVSADGGAWATTSLAGVTNRNTLTDVTCMLGMSNASPYGKWFGAVAEVLIFSGSLKTTAEAASLSLVTATLKAKYAIP